MTPLELDPGVSTNQISDDLCCYYKNISHCMADRDKQEAKPSNQKEAIVSRIFGAYYSILPEPQREPELRAVLRGRLRLEKQDNQRNPLAVGDRVLFSQEEGTEEAIIEEILPRESFLARSSPYETHVLAANVDRAIAVCALKDPSLRPGFIDRFLSACETGNVEPHLAFTKTDLLSEETVHFASSIECLELLRDLVDPDKEPDPPLEERDSFTAESYDFLTALNYRRLGYPCYFLDLLTEETSPDLERLQEVVMAGTTLLTGHSGTGKSTLFNRLFGSGAQKTSDVSESTRKGRHTTTNPILMVLPDGGMVIDTPGIKEWGVAHLDRKELLESFRELEEASEQCRFRNCDHTEGSTDCAVQEILQGQGEEILFPERQKSLDQMLESLKSPDRVRKGDYIKPTGRMRNK
ncbi:MAG: ribosome small subunit-dependent GTPase A [Leptospiraceae bacterium]|nr:ribosome small subunit-dependent GTPase A [Leptospiraceae bacterium]